MRLLIGLLAAVALAGCVPEKVSSAKEPANDPVETIRKSELDPGALPYERANLIMGGISIPVDVDRQVKGSEVTIRLLSEGDSLEYEVYELDGSGFRFRTVGIRKDDGEQFEPAIPVLRFPVEVGESWTWAGKLVTVASKKGTPATATVSLSKDTLNLAAGRADTVLSTVVVELDTGAPQKAKREFKFWFSPNGILKRDFQASSTREPAP